MMYRFLRLIKQLRTRRRDKRVELLGGYPELFTTVEAARFKPQLDESGRVNRTLGFVSQLGPDSFDEATGYPLDNMINAQAEEWRRNLRQQYLHYRPLAYEHLQRAESVVRQYQHHRDDDLMNLRAAEIAVESAMLALSGREPEADADHESSNGYRHRNRRNLRRRAPADDAPQAPDAADGGSDWLGLGATQAALRTARRMPRSELRHLLEPQDARRVPRWGEPGFRDGTLLAGRSFGTYIYFCALVLAVGADVGAFVQVVELVLTSVPDSVVWLVIVGLATVVLYIAHMIGVMLRQARADLHANYGLAGRLGSWLGRRSAAFACTIVWLAIGLMAFWIRLTVPLPTTAQLPTGLGSGGIGSGGGSGLGGGIGSGGIGSGGVGGGSSAASTASTTPHALQGAAIFLGLYLATGIVTALGAYFSHNPYRGRFVAAVASFRRASEQAAASAHQLGLAISARDRQQAEINAAALVLTEAQAQNEAFTAQLKQNVRVAIASMAKDPAVTDALFEEDQQPNGLGLADPLPDDEEPGDSAP
jgi:hypothetical protein